MPVYEITSFRGGLSDEEDKGIRGSFKFGNNLDIRKRKDTLSAGQDLIDEGLTSQHRSPSSSVSPSASVSPSHSPSVTASPSSSISPSSSGSSSQSASSGISPSPSLSPSVSISVSASPTPSASVSLSISPSGGLSTIFAGLILFFVECKDGYTYGFDDAGYIYKRDSEGRWTRVYKDPQGKIKGACEKPSDNGDTYLVWATDNHVKKKKIPGQNNWNDVVVVAGNLTSATWHTMVESGGDAVIANGDTVALLAYDESFTPEALDLVPGNLAKTLIERNGRVIIGTERREAVNKGVNAAIDTEFPLAQIGDDGELFFANMNDSMPVKRFPGGGIVNPGGVCNQIEQASFFEWEEGATSWIDKQSVGNLALFAVYNADTGKNGIYSYGRKNKNHPFVLNLDYLLEADELGAITYVGSQVIVSYKDGTDYGVKATDLNAKAEAVWEGLDLKAPTKKVINVTTWKRAEVQMIPLPTGCWIEFWYKQDKTGSFIRAKTADGHNSFTTALAKEAVFRIVAEGEIHEPRLVLHPYGNTTPEINRLRIFFD